MRGLILTLAAGVVLVAGTRAEAHCEIPCGIYGDDLRFSMLQDSVCACWLMGHTTQDNINITGTGGTERASTWPVARISPCCRLVEQGSPG